MRNIDLNRRRINYFKFRLGESYLDLEYFLFLLIIISPWTLKKQLKVLGFQNLKNR